MNTFRIGKSKMHGLGAIANRDIEKGAKLNHPDPDIDTSFNGYNHSCNPNCKLIPGRLLVLRDIAKDEELTLLYIDCVGPVCNCPECGGDS